MNAPSFLSELRRRNVFRAAALYAGAVWALAQDIAQLAPVFGAPDWITRWFTVAGVVGFPFWIAFAWFFEFTPEGIKRERDVEPGESITHRTGRTLDFWIIGDAAAALKAAEIEPKGTWQDIALALQISSDRAAADAALQKLIKEDATFSPYQIAEVYALRRDADNTLQWLDRTWASRDPGITSLLTDPFILRYRDDPRFAVFCEKAGLPAMTEAKALL